MLLTRPTISVLLPTYRRPDMVRACLEALLRQTLMPEEICVGRRANDDASAELIAEFIHRTDGLVREAVVGPEENLVASMNAALALTTADLIALTDDDAEAPRDWLEKLAAPFSDPGVGGVGGRDLQPHERWDEPEVGIVKWWGKVVGNHHLGAGPPRDVDLLKGVNCCFRGELLRRLGFDTRLRGRGNVSHWEMHLSLACRRAGWRLVYDPAIVVDHHIAPRQDGDVNARGGFELESYFDGVHNSTLAVVEHLPTLRRYLSWCWSEAIGTRGNPGLVQVIRLGMRRHEPVTLLFLRWIMARRGRQAARQTWRTTVVDQRGA